jgi:uncharacterized membrane protein YecN with MAPEG domain
MSSLVDGPFPLSDAQQTGGSCLGSVAYTPAQMVLIALSEAAQTTIALVFIFGVLFPAIVTGCIIFAAAQAISERQQNLRRRQGQR